MYRGTTLDNYITVSLCRERKLNEHWCRNKGKIKSINLNPLYFFFKFKFFITIYLDVVLFGTLFKIILFKIKLLRQSE